MLIRMNIYKDTVDKIQFAFRSMFLNYFIVGIFNTIIHWSIFTILWVFLDATQATGNISGFLCAVTISYLLNAKFTFNRKPTGIKYCLFLCFMGSLTYILGYCGDIFSFFPFITMILSSAISLVLGFLFSKYIVFK